jgi:hypothetical protein
VLAKPPVATGPSWATEPFATRSSLPPATSANRGAGVVAPPEAAGANAAPPRLIAAITEVKAVPSVTRLRDARGRPRRGCISSTWGG